MSKDAAGSVLLPSRRCHQPQIPEQSRTAWVRESGEGRGRPKLPKQPRSAQRSPQPQTASCPGYPGNPALRPPASNKSTLARGTTHIEMLLPLGAPPGNSRIPIGSSRVGPGAPRLEAEGLLGRSSLQPPARAEVGSMPVEGPGRPVQPVRARAVSS